MTGAAAAPRMPALDALRGVLALFVCLGHAGQAFIAPVIDDAADVSPIMVYGALSFALSRWAVLCFFVLSGFMIALSVQQNTINLFLNIFHAFSCHAVALQDHMGYTYLISAHFLRKIDQRDHIFQIFLHQNGIDRK